MKTRKLTPGDVSDLALGEYRDTEVRGLVLRVRPSGLRTFEVRYTHRTSGTRSRLTIGETSVMSLDVARKKAKTIIGGVWTGSDPARELRRRGRMTVGELGTLYMESKTLAESTRIEYDRMLASDDFLAIAAREAETLPREIVAAWGGKIAQRAGVMANRYFAMVRSFINWGNEKGHLRSSPFIALKPPYDKERTKKRKRVLSFEELRALMIALDKLEGRAGEHIAWAMRLLLLTGVREDSAVEARRSQFERMGEAKDARWRIPPLYLKLREETREEAEPFVQPLSLQAHAHVQKRLEAMRGCEILLPRVRPARSVGKDTTWWSSKTVAKIKEKMDEALGRPAPSWTTHNLRHTLTTHMEDYLRVSPVITDAIIGHRSRSVSQALSDAHGIYSAARHLRAKREALQAWADLLDRIRTRPLEELLQEED